MFRELRYGLIFFAWAIFGLLLGAFTGYGLAGPAINAGEVAIVGAVAGTIAGSVGWLIYKRLCIDCRTV